MWHLSCVTYPYITKTSGISRPKINTKWDNLPQLISHLGKYLPTFICTRGKTPPNLFTYVGNTSQPYTCSWKTPLRLYSHMEELLQIKYIPGTTTLNFIPLRENSSQLYTHSWENTSQISFTHGKTYEDIIPIQPNRLHYHRRRPIVLPIWFK